MKTKWLRTFVALLLTTLATATAWAADTTKPTVYKTEIKAVRVGSQSVDIFWHPAEDDVTPQAAITYYAYIAEGWGSGPYTRENVLQRNGTNHEFQNLKPNTKYRIFVTAADEAGNTLEYDLLKIETPSLDTQSPTVVDNRVFVTDYTETTISLKWAAAFDNQTSQDKLRYIVKCYQDKHYCESGWLDADRHYFDQFYSVQGKNEITITDLEAGYETFLWVQVLDEDNNGQNINDPLEPIVVTLPDLDGRTPSHLNSSDMFANAVSTETSISLSWKPAWDNVTPKEKMRYQVQYLDCKATGLSYSHFAHHGFKESCKECKKYLTTTPWMENVTSYSIEGLKPNTEYVVRLVAKDQAGHCTPYSGPGCNTKELIGWPYAMDIKTKKIDTQPPYASNPTIKVTGNTENSINIKWEPATDDTTEPDEMRYEVFYQEINDTEWYILGYRYRDPNSPYAFIEELKPNTAYNIQVIAFDRKDKMFVYDPCTSLTLPSTDKTPPTVSNPTVWVAKKTYNSVTLEWYAADDNNTPRKQLLYSIDYSDGHAQVIGLNTSYTITGLAPSTTYTFNVAVVDNNHNETKYNPITVTTDADPYVDNTPPTTTDKNINVSDLSHNSFTLSWERATDNNTPKDQILYKVYLTNVKNPQPDDFWLVYQNHGISSYTMVGLKSSTTFSYLVEASDIDGNYVLYNIGSVTTKADPTVVQKYDLYIKSQQVTSANAADVLGDGGSVSYDANTNTLQFKDAHIDAGGENALSTSEDLNIQLVGDNVIDGYISTVGCHATMFCGNGTLTVNAKNKHIAYETNGDLTIKNGCTVQFYSADTYAMSLGFAKLTVNNSTLKANGGQAKETIVRCGDLELIGCEILSGHTYEYGNSSFYDEIGDLATDQIIIGPADSKDTEAPTIPDSKISTYNLTENSVDLAWTKARDNSTPRSRIVYNIWYKKSSDSEYSFETRLVDSDNYSLRDLEANTSYDVRIAAIDEMWNATDYDILTFTTLANTSETYALEVMNIKVTSKNCSDVLGDGGTVTYDNATQTLTLTNANLTGENAINAKTQLNINLVGNSTISGNIHNDQSTYFCGTGSLYVTGKDAAVFGDDITMADGVKVQFNGTDDTPGLDVSGYINVVASTLSVTSNGKVPTIVSCAGLRLSGSYIASGQTYDDETKKFIDADGNESTAEIRIHPTGTVVPVKTVRFSADNVDMTVDETRTLSTIINPIYATNKELYWSSSNVNVATVDNNGTVTALIPGYAIITCTAIDGSNAEASCLVNVKDRLTQEIKLSQTEIYTNIGKTFQLEAVVSPNKDTQVSWSTSDPSVAVVAANGMVLAMGLGNAVITCTAEDGSGVTASCYVYVLTPDNIKTIDTDASDKHREGIYSIDGIKQKEAQRGLNIIVTDDGKKLKMIKK